jgi:hypothetical protein
MMQNRGLETPEEVFYLDETLEQRKFSSGSLKEAIESGEWQMGMGRYVEITRAWGMVGLFWALVLEELKKGRPHTCERCQRPLEGRKKFCGPKDDLSCYRNRRALDRARERTYHAQRQR